MINIYAMREQVVIDLQLMSHEPLNKIQSEDKTHLNHTDSDCNVTITWLSFSNSLFSFKDFSNEF